MQRTLFSGVAATVLLAVATVLPASAGPGGSLTVPVTGIINKNQPAAGTLNISRFETSDQQVYAVGTLAMAPVANPSQVSIVSARVPVILPSASSGSAGALAPTAAAGPTCSILSLTLGPLHLDLLGLVIDLNTVNLNITAQQGAGNLLGNLLCAIANLLNGTNLGSLLQQLVNALNGLLGAL